MDSSELKRDIAIGFISVAIVYGGFVELHTIYRWIQRCCIAVSTGSWVCRPAVIPNPPTFSRIVTPLSSPIAYLTYALDSVSDAKRHVCRTTATIAAGTTDTTLSNTPSHRMQPIENGSAPGAGIWHSILITVDSARPIELKSSKSYIDSRMKWNGLF